MKTEELGEKPDLKYYYFVHHKYRPGLRSNLGLW